MDKHRSPIDNMLSKLKVLDSRIQKLESLTDEVLSEVESTYRQQINELTHTDLPAPVAPAINKCGMAARSAATVLPATS